MVEIFKTNVAEPVQAEQILSVLQTNLPACQVNFDLHDCEKILRVKGEIIPIDTIIDLVTGTGFICHLLD